MDINLKTDRSNKLSISIIAFSTRDIRDRISSRLAIEEAVGRIDTKRMRGVIRPRSGELEHRGVASRRPPVLLDNEGSGPAEIAPCLTPQYIGISLVLFYGNKAGVYLWRVYATLQGRFYAPRDRISEIVPSFVGNDGKRLSRPMKNANLSLFWLLQIYFTTDLRNTEC